MSDACVVPEEVDGGEEEAPFGLPTDPGEMSERDETIEQIVRTVHRLFEAFSNWFVVKTYIQLFNQNSLFRNHVSVILCSDALVFASLVDDDARFVRTAYNEDGVPEYIAYPKVNLKLWFFRPRSALF